MKCAVCGADNAADSAFCFRCGSALTAPAPATGATVDLSREPAESTEGGYTYRSDEPKPASVQAAPPAFSTPPVYNARPNQPHVPQPGQVQSGHAQQYVVPAYAAPTNSLAVVALVMSVLSFIFLPIVGAIAGIICGYLARKELKAANGQQSGDGMATAGIIIGWVHIGLIVVAIVGFCMLAAIGSTLD